MVETVNMFILLQYINYAFVEIHQLTQFYLKFDRKNRFKAKK